MTTAGSAWAARSAKLSGAERADSGDMLLDGAAFRPNSPEAARRAGVAIVYQEPLFCADLSVRENILLGNEPTRRGIVDRRRAVEVAQRALAQVGAARSFDLEAPLRSLSPADRQLVSIARALSSDDCKVLILDEPTSALTGADTERLFEVVRRLSSSGVTVTPTDELGRTFDPMSFPVSPANADLSF